MLCRIVVCRMSLWECERDSGECHRMRALRILRTNANVLDLDIVGIVPDWPLYVRLSTCVWDAMKTDLTVMQII